MIKKIHIQEPMHKELHRQRANFWKRLTQRARDSASSTGLKRRLNRRRWYRRRRDWEREGREGEKVESVEEKEKRLLASSMAFANVGAFLKSLCGTLSFTYYNILFYFYITVVGCGRCKQSCWSWAAAAYFKVTRVLAVSEISPLMFPCFSIKWLRQTPLD